MGLYEGGDLHAATVLKHGSFVSTCERAVCMRSPYSLFSRGESHIHSCPRQGRCLKQVGAWTLLASWCFCLSLSSRGRPHSKCPCLPQNVHVASLAGHLSRGWASLLHQIQDFFPPDLPSGFDLQYCAKVMQTIIDEYRDISAIFNEILP